MSLSQNKKCPAIIRKNVDQSKNLPFSQNQNSSQHPPLDTIDEAALQAKKTAGSNNLSKPKSQLLINIKDDTIYIPFFKDGAVSAGFGTTDFQNDCDFLPFKKQDLRLMFGIVSTLAIGIIPCVGNSMQPTIEEGELVVFQADGTQTEGAIYVIRLEGELFVKRLRKRPRLFQTTKTIRQSL